VTPLSKARSFAYLTASTLAFAVLWHAEINAVPATPVLSQPQVMAATVTLSWTLPFGSTAIRLQAGTAPGLSNVANVVFAAISTYTVTAVPNGTYYVRVRAIDPSGESASSNEVTVVVGGGPACSSPPGAPTLSDAIVTVNLVGFRWRPASAGCPATAFVVQAGSVPGQSNLAIVNVGDLQSFAATAPNGTYYIRVVAQNAFGVSAPSNEVVAVVGSPSSPPAPLPPPLPSLSGEWRGGVQGNLILPSESAGRTDLVVDITHTKTRVVGVVRGTAPGMGISFDGTQRMGSSGVPTFGGTLRFEGRPQCSWEGTMQASSSGLTARFSSNLPLGVSTACSGTWNVALRRP